MRIATVAVATFLCTLAAAPRAQDAAKTEPVARVNGHVITEAEVERALGQNLAKLQEQIYTLKRAQMESLIADQLIAMEASKRGVAPSALIDAEITSQAPPPTDEEVLKFFEANKGRLKGDLPSLRDQIRTFLAGQRANARRQEFVKRLREQADVQVFLKAPPIIRSEVSTDGAYARGPANAPVTIVEFSDFHCPYCRRVQPVLSQLLARYEGKLRIVYKDMPLDNLHPDARLASEAARCAGDQGRFWQYHDKLYAAGTADASPGTLKQYAQELGLDAERFEACRSSRKYQAQVQEDVQEGARLGVNGTPGFFINGRFIAGAQPLESFTRIIDEELAGGR